MSVCPIALFSVFTKVINEIKDVSFAIIFKKMLSICLFFTECKPVIYTEFMLVKKKHVFTEIENLKWGKCYVLFSAVSLLISDIL